MEFIEFYFLIPLLVLDYLHFTFGLYVDFFSIALSYFVFVLFNTLIVLLIIPLGITINNIDKALNSYRKIL